MLKLEERQKRRIYLPQQTRHVLECAWMTLVCMLCLAGVLFVMIYVRLP